MRTEATYAEVTEAIRTFMDGYPYAVEIDETFLFRLANSLKVDLRAGPSYEQRDLQERFSRQARRALNTLAAEGVLVKEKNGNNVLFTTPETHARREREQKAREAELQAERERKIRLRHRITALGIPDVSPGRESLTLNLSVVEALVDLAEHGWAMRKVRKEA